MMQKKIPYGLKRSYKEELEDSFDTSWLSSSISSPKLPKNRLDLSYIMRPPENPSNRTSISINQSFEDISFFRSEFNTPRVVKASHDVSTKDKIKMNLTQSFCRSKPRVITLKNKTISENILLDIHPRNHK